MSNQRHYGFRVHRYLKGEASGTAPLEADIADAYAKTINGVGVIDTYPGDFMLRVADGTLAHADGTEGAGGAVPGLCVITGVTQYADSLGKWGGDYVPRSTTSGGVDDKRTIVQYLPITDALWALEVDDETAYTTLATYKAIRGLNVNIINLGTSGKQDPKVDISTAAVTATLHFRIVDILRHPGTRDYSAAGVSLVLQSNLSTAAGTPATPVAGI